MVKSCCAWGCTNRQSPGLGLGFFRIPVDIERRQKWIQAIRRENWTPTASDRLCGAHFVTGRPNSKDRDHPDYIPTVFSFKQNSKLEGRKSLARFDRSSGLKKRRESSILAEPLSLNNAEEINTDATHADENVMHDNTVLESESLNKEIMCLREERTELLEEIENLKFGWNKIFNNDKKTLFFTGISSFAVLLCLFDFVSAKVEISDTKLTLKNEFLLTLMKLRLNSPFDDLADRFNISKGTASKIFHKWLEILHARLQCLILWPDKETTLKTLPSAFQKHFRKVRCIIDCSEIFIERPTSFKARSQTYSNYKKHNTVKFLIGVTPSGVISFLSPCYGGKISDKEITRRSGFYEKLECGDVVLADRGFLIADELALRSCELIIPAFTRGKKQLSQKDVELSRRMSRVRIHVERIIGLLKNKYTILQGVLPISLVSRNGDTVHSTIDKIVVVCSALTNLCEPVV